MPNGTQTSRDSNVISSVLIIDGSMETLLELYSHAIRNSWNRIFIFDYALYLDFVKENPECVFYLPLAVNVENSDRARRMIGEEEQKKYASDITFIGSLYTEKSPLRKVNGLPVYMKGYFDGGKE